MREDDNQYGSFEHKSRFTELGGKWFFDTREGLNMGPYSSLAVAEKQFQKFLNLVTFVERKKEKSNTISARCQVNYRLEA